MLYIYLPFLQFQVYILHALQKYAYIMLREGNFLVQELMVKVLSKYVVI